MADRKLTVTLDLNRDSFSRFVKDEGSRLLQGLSAAYGRQVGEDVTSEALAYAWEHWDTVRVMTNPVGYLYRVGQTKASRGIFRRPPPVVIERPTATEGWFEPGLPHALASLTNKQKAAVTLVHGFGWTITEVAQLWNVTPATVREHVDNGLKRLRERLRVET